MPNLRYIRINIVVRYIFNEKNAILRGNRRTEYNIPFYYCQDHMK